MTEPIAQPDFSRLPTVFELEIESEEGVTELGRHADGNSFWKVQENDPRRQALLSVFLRGRRGLVEL